MAKLIDISKSMVLIRFVRHIFFQILRCLSLSHSICVCVSTPPRFIKLAHTDYDTNHSLCSAYRIHPWRWRRWWNVQNKNDQIMIFVSLKNADFFIACKNTKHYKQIRYFYKKKQFKKHDMVILNVSSFDRAKPKFIV